MIVDNAGQPVWFAQNDAGNVTSVAGTLSDEDIDNLANYIGTLN